MRKVFTFVAIILISCALCNFVFLEDNLQQQEKCPQFTCNASNPADNKCYVSDGKDPLARKTTLFTCPDKKECQTPDVWTYTLNSECVDIVPGPAPQKNYLPGEVCEADDDCKLVNLVKGDSDTETETVKKCTNKKCQGNEPTKKCVNHESCTVGHFCADFNETDKKRGVCKPYVKEGEACTDDFACPFNLTCLKNKCSKLRTLAVGTELASPLETSQCVTGYAANDKDNKLRCAHHVYDSTKHTTIVNNEVVECQPNSDCYYASRFSDATDKDVPVAQQQKCLCSFNGKGYCPFAGFNFAKRADKIAAAAANVSAKENLHHTKNRNQEYIKSTDDLKYGATCRGYYASAHSYQSPSVCADATRNYKYCTYISSSFLKFSFVLLGLILALL